MSNKKKMIYVSAQYIVRVKDAWTYTRRNAV